MADTLIQGTTIIEDKRSDKGEVWSASGTLFTTENPDVNDYSYGTTDGGIIADADNLRFFCPVNLPQGVTITKVIVQGNAAAIAGITWTLRKIEKAGSTNATIATAAVGTEDNTITEPVVDNNNFTYFIGCGANEFDINDKIFGAQITYEF